MGLVSDGGVHSSLTHLALLELARRSGVPVAVHAFTDGRDTSPTGGVGYLSEVQKAIDAKGVERSRPSLDGTTPWIATSAGSGPGSLTTR